MEEHPGPLAGVRVVDLTAMVMGPYSTQVMADMGAYVIKVEPPAEDTTRYISAAPEPGMGDVNRSKRSVVLDLRIGDGQNALRTLVARSDVFIVCGAETRSSGRGNERRSPSRRVTVTNPDLIE
jgi:crotonobetainyl-CoA:carnitine CoA-transferase CaiB-like acyl-CoA transferase